jgi:signal transduction histidine kinase
MRTPDMVRKALKALPTKQITKIKTILAESWYPCGIFTITSEKDVSALLREVKKLALLLKYKPATQKNVVNATRELAVNALQHGKGGMASLNFIKESRAISVQIQDFGKGFDLNEELNAGGGLTRLRDYIANGTFAYEKNEQGAWVEVQFVAYKGE